MPSNSWPSGLFSHFPNAWKCGETLQFRRKDAFVGNFSVYVVGADINPWLMAKHLVLYYSLSEMGTVMLGLPAELCE